MNLKQMLLIAAAWVAMSVCGVEIVWSGDVAIPDGATVVCTDHSQLTSLAIPATATVKFQTATAPTCTITGSGTIVKDCVDTWTPTTPIEGFSGDYRIAQGIAQAGTVRHAFGNDNSANTRLTVEKGASLVVSQTLAYLFSSTRIHLAGEGVLAADGVSRRGALEMPGVVFTSTILNHVVLDDDATLTTKKGGIWFLNGSLTTNGHKLTATGGGNMTIFTSNVPSDGGEIYVQSPDGTTYTRLTLRSWTSTTAPWNPGTKIPAGDSPFIMSGANDIQIYGGVQPVNRPLWISGEKNTLTLSTNGGVPGLYATNTANWAGPVVFTNTTGMSSLRIANEVSGGTYTNRMLVVSGPISGPGNVTLDNSHANDRVALLAKNSTYSGFTYILNNYLSSTLLGYPGSVPANNYSVVTAVQGYVDLAVGDSYDRWTLDDFYKFRTQACFTADKAVARFSSEYTTNGLGPIQLTSSVTNGAGIYMAARDRVRFEGMDNADPLSFCWQGGQALVTGPQPIRLGTSLLDFRKQAAAESEVRIENADVTVDYSGDIILGRQESSSSYRTSRLVITNSLVRCSDVMRSNHGSNWQNVRGGTLTIGYRTHGTLEILPGTVITNRLVAGSYGDDGCWTCGGMGGIYQRGGAVVALGGTLPHLSSGIGMGQAGSHGYYEITGGSLTARGSFNIGGYCAGVFAQYGGTVLITNRLDQAATASAGFQMANCNGGHGVIYLQEGCFTVGPYGDLWIGKSSLASTNEITLVGPNAVLNAGSGRAYLGYGAAGGSYCYNFNGGVYRGGGMELHTQGGKIDHATTRFDVNFNGGTFKVGAYGNLFGPTSDDSEVRAKQGARNVVVFKGGMTIDTDGQDCLIASRIRKPQGYGLKAITLATALTDDSYVGSPRVTISGDCAGATATAFAHYDSTNHCVDTVRITSPGEYTTTDAATARLVFKKDSVIKTLSAANGEIEFEENDTTGSFTKKGAGTLVLTYAGTADGLTGNDWGGGTFIEGGTLKLSAAYALPPTSPVTIANGAVLDCNHLPVTIAALNYGPGGGTVINAENATLPTATTLTTSVADILAGRVLALAGDYAGANLTLQITGTFPSEAPEKSYTVATTTGNFTGTPTVEMEALPRGWVLRIENDQIRIKRFRALVVNFR